MRRTSDDNNKDADSLSSVLDLMDEQEEMMRLDGTRIQPCSVGAGPQIQVGSNSRKRQRTTIRTSNSWFWSVLFASCMCNKAVRALSCNTTSDCRDSDSSATCLQSICYKKNSSLVPSQSTEADANANTTTTAGQPANPYERGCLHYHGKSRKIRVCNSDDPPTAADAGLCRIPDFDYMEIRLLNNNWESAVFETWILQIILSELLDVPTTTESAQANASINFYNPDAKFEFGNPTDLDAIVTAASIGDCELADRSADNYEPCAHVITEMWEAHEAFDLSKNGSSETPYGLGPLGQEGWFVPKFTGERDPSLLSYLGIQGQENRRKLAERFLRPTSWGDYCRQVSQNGCKIPDENAKRAPRNDKERQRYYAKDTFTGYFRATEQNDCDKWPLNCTGHIVDYPCGWSSYVSQMAYHLDIALQSDGSGRGSGGYSYEQMVETWLAANHTKSDIAMMWWSPDPLYQSFVRTDAEFSRINLPPPTQACEEARVSTKHRCSLIEAERVGEAVGACDETVKPLYKIITASLSNTNDEIPQAGHSPAYEAIKLFQITTTQLGEVMTAAIHSDNPREGVCQWVAENMDYANQFIPPKYPRYLLEQVQSSSLLYTSKGLSTAAAMLCLFSIVMVVRQRNRRVMIFAQVEFLYLILAGLLAVSVGAIISCVPPSQILCIPIIWLIDLGYTLELVPLIAKVGAINRLLNAAATMKRVVVRRKSMYGAVVGVSALVCVFLLVWTVLDPPLLFEEIDLTSDVTDFGETIVIATSYCKSDSSAWTIVSLAWRAVLLVCATVLAFQNRNLRQNFNESQTLGLMIYSQFVFVVLRIIMFIFLPNEINQSTLRFWFSILYSLDTIATIMIYFIPKFVTPDEKFRGPSGHPSTAVPGAAWLSMLSRSQIERLQGKDSGNYYDRRMRSEMPESELVRDDMHKKSCDETPSEGSDVDEIGSGAFHPTDADTGSNEMGLRRRRACAHCGKDPDNAASRDDCSSPTCDAPIMRMNEEP